MRRVDQVISDKLSFMGTMIGAILMDARHPKWSGTHYHYLCHVMNRDSYERYHPGQMTAYTQLVITLYTDDSTSKLMFKPEAADCRTIQGPEWENTVINAFDSPIHSPHGRIVLSNPMVGPAPWMTITVVRDDITGPTPELDAALLSLWKSQRIESLRDGWRKEIPLLVSTIEALDDDPGIDYETN